MRGGSGETDFRKCRVHIMNKRTAFTQSKFPLISNIRASFLNSHRKKGHLNITWCYVAEVGIVTTKGYAYPSSLPRRVGRPIVKPKPVEAGRSTPCNFLITALIAKFLRQHAPIIQMRNYLSITNFRTTRLFTGPLTEDFSLQNRFPLQELCQPLQGTDCGFFNSLGT